MALYYEAASSGCICSFARASSAGCLNYTVLGHSHLKERRTVTIGQRVSQKTGIFRKSDDMAVSLNRHNGRTTGDPVDQQTAGNEWLNDTKPMNELIPNVS